MAFKNVGTANLGMAPAARQKHLQWMRQELRLARPF